MECEYKHQCGSFGSRRLTCNCLYLFSRCEVYKALKSDEREFMETNFRLREIARQREVGTLENSGF